MSDDLIRLALAVDIHIAQLRLANPLPSGANPPPIGG